MALGAMEPPRFGVLFVLVGIGAGSWVGFRDSASAHARTAHRARLDALTGLPNRPHFTERLSQALPRAAWTRSLYLFPLG